MLVTLKLETADNAWSIYHQQSGAFLVNAETVQLENVVIEEQSIRGTLVALSGYDFPPASNQIREFMNHRRHNFNYPTNLKPAVYREHVLTDKKSGDKINSVRTLILDHLTIVYKE